MASTRTSTKDFTRIGVRMQNFTRLRKPASSTLRKASINDSSIRLA
jgi:hypothetical protein